MKHDAMLAGPSHQGGASVLMLADSGHENFDAFLGYVLDHYTAETDLGPYDSSQSTEHAAALQVEEVPPC